MTAADFDILLDGSTADDDLPVLDLPPDCLATEAAAALESFFVDDTSATRVIVSMGEHVAGISSREHLQRIGSAVLRSIGEGDGATLPGESLQYRILRFRCSVCGAERRRIHLDRRSMPLCPNGHGPLDLQP
jgi:hypothetical protein